MRTIDKLEDINSKLDTINNVILKNKKWKMVFMNKGVNNYCICVVEKKKEISSHSFATYPSVSSALELILSMFDKALNDTKSHNKK